MKYNKRALAVDRYGMKMDSRLHYFVGFRGMYFECLKNKGHKIAIKELKLINKQNDDNN